MKFDEAMALAEGQLLNEEVLNVVSNRMSNYKRLKVLYDYLIKLKNLINFCFLVSSKTFFLI